MWLFENGNFIEKYETESLSKLFTKIISRYMREINWEIKLKIIEENAEYLCDLEVKILFLKPPKDKLKRKP